MHIARPCEAYVGASMYILLVVAPVVALCIISTNSGVIPVAARGQGSLIPAGTGRVGVRTAAAGARALCVREGGAAARARGRIGSCRWVLKTRY